MFHKKNFKYFAIVFLVINFVIYRIRCDEECICENDENNGDDNKDKCLKCNPNCIFYNNKCITCPELSSKPYYRIITNEDSTLTCETIKEKEEDNNNYKLLYGSKEFVLTEVCTDPKIIIEDICYPNDQDFTNLKFIKDNDNNKYYCSNFYYKEKKDGFTYMICVDKCPYKYQYYDSDNHNECLEICPNEKFLKRDNNIFRCSSQCVTEPSEKKEYEYEYKESSASTPIKYCLDKCPNEAKYTNENENKCIETCIVGKYLNGGVCSSSCIGTKYNVDINKKILICPESTASSEGSNGCSEDYPYLFKENYCLKSCKDSNNELFDQIEGVEKAITYLNENQKKCLKESEGEGYIDKIELKWVENCKSSSSGPYYEGKVCKKTCDNKINSITLECILGCNSVEFTVKDSKFCYPKCPGEKNFINSSIENECQTCNNPNDPEHLVDGEGYYKDDGKCYPSCDKNHNNGDNYCFTQECKTFNKFKPSDSNICYNSCEEIKSLGYNYEKDYICYKGKPTIGVDSEYIYYYSSSGIYKYTKNQEDCLKAGYSYLEGSECVKQCQSKEKYRALPSNNKLGICFDSTEPIPEKCKFYNKTTNICSDNCEFFIIEDSTYINDKEENCVLQCPENLYEYEKEKICKSDCDLSFVSEEPKKKCMHSCDKFQLGTEPTKKCVDKCKKDDGSYMNFKIENGNKICKDNCDEGEYSLSKEDDHQFCLSKCPDTHPYYDNNKICVNKCNYYKQNNECADNCENDQYVFPGNYCSTNKCPSNAPFYYSKRISTSGKVKICVSNCGEIEDNKYKYYKINKVCDTNEPQMCYEEKECVENCGGDNSINLNYEGRCVDKCPDGLFQNETASCISRCNPNIYEKVFDNENENNYILKCLSNCPSQENDVKKYLTYSGECVSVCPNGENYIGSNNKCLSSCKENIGKDFYQKIEGTNNYKCLENCGELLNIEGTKECVTSCNTLYEYNGTCYKSCLSNSKPYQFSTINESGGNGKNICSDKCHETQSNYANDKICKSGCSDLPFNKTINDTEGSKACVEECDLNSDYKFLDNETNGEISTFYCRTTCNSNNKRYLKSNYKCLDKCPEPNNFIEENGDNPIECLNKCPNDKPYARLENEEYICSNIECGKKSEDNSKKQDHYYIDKKICIEKCEDNDYIIEINDLKICTTSCDYYDSKKLYSYEKEGIPQKKCVFLCNETVQDNNLLYSSLDGKCAESCGEKEYYDINDKICRIKCPVGKKIDGQECKDTCYAENAENKYENENGFCVKNCSESKTGYIYHKKDEYKCINACPNLYLEGNECTQNCSENNPYMYGKLCYPRCPMDKRFFTEDNNTCIFDCPKDKPYYKITGTDPDFKYECSSICKAYIENPDKNMNAKKCLGDQCNDDQYYIEVGTGDQSQHICYTECPSTYPFQDGKKCLTECPESKVHNPNEYKCISYQECESKIIKYDDNQCVERCSLTDYIYEETIESNKITFCVKNCSMAEKIYSKYHESSTITFKKSFDNKCLEQCPQFSEANNNNECVCKRLFYYNKTTSVKYCLNPDLTMCETIKDYPILKMGENECSNYCEGILSLSGTECHNDNYKCEQNETIITEINGDRKCTCVDKYYHVTENERKVKKCLGQNDECPLTFPKYIKETKECVEECPDEKYNKKYGKICASSCPYLTTENETDHTCKCAEKWYINDNYEVVCLNGECPIGKELLIESTKQCVSTCVGTGFEVYSNKKCFENCDDTKDKVNSNEDPTFKNLAQYYCRCKNTWYIDINGNEVCKNEDISCVGIDNLNFKFMIKPTKQCVNSCPDNYPYIFNNECLLDCGSEHNKNDITKICECKNLWKYEEDGKTKTCLTENNCGNEYLLIKSTNECYKGDKCPKSNPLLFENICYEKNNCPKDLNTKYDDINEKCICANKWYEQENKIICLSESSDCPQDFPYLIYSTKECIKKESATEDLYEFNSIFYKNCPEKTKKDDSSKKCICDPLLGYWYSNQTSDGRDIMYCSQEACPAFKPYNEYQKKECIPICTAPASKSYQGICYEKCPNLTETTDAKPNECQLKLVDSEITLTNLEKQMKENIVDLYAKSNSLKNDNPNIVKKIITTNATVEFYGVNKNNKGNSKQNIQSDLSYIDISECIEKIYSANNMKNNEDIVILKYDIKKIPNNFLINPVEYKFINSETGQELDATVCEHNSIKISYPVHDLINKYDALMKNLRKLEYINIDLISNNKESLREKFDKGKEIVGDYSDIDIFNINDKIYSDICIAVEVDGKDLVLEDRVNYFYPQLSLCENNCTYNHTDFTNERIYCDCSYKIEFDFEREYNSFPELNMKEININQKGNSNIAVMKCLSNLKYSKSLKNNGGFIFTLIIIIIEVVLLFIIILYDINLISKKLKDKMNNDRDEFDQIEINVVNTFKKKTYEDVKTTQRMLDNPPKKKVEDYGMEFIPQEYLFLFFNHGQKDICKKVERNNVPFKTKSTTKILLEQKKGVNYNNIKPTGPFPQGQNLLIIVDKMDEEIDDFMKIYNKGKNIDNDGENNENNNNNQNDKETNNGEKKSEKKNVYKEKTGKTISDYDPSDENYSVFDLDGEENPVHEKGFIDNLKINQRLMRRNYDIAIKNKKTNFFELLITEIIDKIYITKIIFFTKKFDIFTLQISVYLLCHTLLLVLNALFFDIKTIKKIWSEENYPGLGYYLGFGLLSCIIIWIVYKVFLCLLSNNDKIKEILKMIHYNNKYNMNKENAIYIKRSKLIWKIKFKISIYSIIEFVCLIFSFLYLSVFCSVYTGTKTRVFKAYGIALIEVLIIKILYGIALSIMRYISLSKQKKGLYEVVLFMNTYLV